MKHFLYALSLGTILCMASQPASATIWRLNNSNGGTLTPNIAASFPVGTTLQQAHDNASVLSGDTIHVEQSTTSYGDLTMTKRLTIIGAGYFLGMNSKTQVNTSTASPVGNITMNASTCAGSTITGLTINGIVYMGTNRLSVLRNRIFGYSSYPGVYVGNSTTSSATDSNIIAGNYIEAPYYGIIAFSSSIPNLTNCIIMNNFINGYYNSISLPGAVSGMIKNNVLNGAAMSVNNMYVVNNISTYTAANTFYNCLIEYNLGYNASGFQTPSGSGNTFTGTTNLANSTQGFVGGTTSTDGAWDITASSPAKGTGKSGDDMGMFGGTLPYKLSGIPTVPNVYSLSIGTVAAGATSISVTVSTKSN